MQSLIMEPEAPVQRTEPLKFLPVFFMSSTMMFLYVVYVLQHCLPRMQLDVDSAHVDSNIRARGQWEMAVFHGITAILLVCYFRAMFTSPGTIPAGDKNWDYHVEAQDFGCHLPSFLKEKKRSGDRRHCKWCSKFKPDRTHHCRVCKTCTLKMDHHCPWIYNCVGYFNYKFFFLLLFYCMLDLHLISWTMAETVQRVMEVQTPFYTMFIIFFAETLAVFLALLVTLFFAFHVYLTVNAMSTIEFCEKHLPKPDAKDVDTSLYDLGLYGNFAAVLGDQVFAWLLPVNGPSGDGLVYASASQPKTHDELDATKLIPRQKRSERTVCEDAGCM
mmetsp:Transcript_96993/g.230732  ORF Transcript_96993/g.230732 Transcript_96993/m.230732 type:complete len:330 (-) Transcript_96993:43-1032(-)